MVAAEQGLIDEKMTKADAAMHIHSLRQIVQSAGRFREARFLIYFEVDLAPSPEQKLQDFLQLLNDSKWDTEKALTLADIANYLLKSEDEVVVAKAHQTLEEAQQLFSKLSHGFGCIDLDLIRISGNRSISAGEKFVRKTEIANRYFQAGHYQNGIRCLAFAISPEMAIDLYYEHAVNALELLERKIDEVGSETLKQISLIHSVYQASLKAPEYGYALKSLESYHANVPEEIGPKLHSQLLWALGMVYASFGDFQKAIRTAEESLEIAESGAFYDVQSDAAFTVGIHRFSASKLYPEGSAEAIHWRTSAMEFMKEWADKDSENGYIYGEIQKCLQIAGWESLRALENPDTIASSPEQTWIDRVEKHIPDSEDALKRSQLVDVKITMLMRQQKYRESLKMASEYLDDVNKIASVHPMTRAYAFFRASIQARLYAFSSIHSGQTLTTETTQFALKQLWSALSLAHKALQLYREANGTEATLDCTVSVWDILSGIVNTIEESTGREFLSLFMMELRQTEQVCDQMRRSVVPISRLRSLMDKRLLVSKKASLKLYSIGVSLALRLNDPADAWLWLQKGKARAFADLLGANLLIPKELLGKINSDFVARGLLEEEQSTLDLLNEPGANYVTAARQLALVRERMAENRLLVEVSRIRDGMFDLDLVADDLLTALSRTGLTPEQIKFVDWNLPMSTDQLGSHIALFVRKLDGSTTVKQLPVSALQVKDWVTKAYTYPDMADPPLSKKTGNRFLRSMSGLLEGLSELTDEDDLLILSPSGPINSVPVHALFVDGKPLIQRNLVVYSSSTATLGQCLNRIKTGSDLSKRDAKDSTQFFAVYEEPFKAVEREHVFNHIRSLESGFPGSISLGPEVTKSHFLKQCSMARWVHYHGHAKYGKDDVLKSSLVLSDGADLFAEPIDGGDIDLGRDELSVSELFTTNLPSGGVHFTIIACDSGTQDIAPGDEPLGIIPALLHAGATSVLGCQWPIDSRAGRAFSEAFYEELIRTSTQIEDSSNNTIQIAKALRNTVERMSSGKLGVQYKQPYYWAPFALHGLFFFPGSSSLSGGPEGTIRDVNSTSG